MSFSFLKNGVTVELESTNYQATTWRPSNFLKYPLLTDRNLDSTASPSSYYNILIGVDDYQWKEWVTAEQNRIFSITSSSSIKARIHI